MVEADQDERRDRLLAAFSQRGADKDFERASERCLFVMLPPRFECWCGRDSTV